MKGRYVVAPCYAGKSYYHERYPDLIEEADTLFDEAAAQIGTTRDAISGYWKPGAPAAQKALGDRVHQRYTQLVAEKLAAGKHVLGWIGTGAGPLKPAALYLPDTYFEQMLKDSNKEPAKSLNRLQSAISQLLKLIEHPIPVRLRNESELLAFLSKGEDTRSRYQPG